MIVDFADPWQLVAAALYLHAGTLEWQANRATPPIDQTDLEAQVMMEIASEQRLFHQARLAYFTVAICFIFCWPAFIAVQQIGGRSR